LAFLIASASPVVIFLYLINRKDRIQEPPALLRRCFLWGIGIALPAVLIEWMLGITGSELSEGFFQSAYTAFVVAALTEELLKWWVLKKIVWKNAHFDEHYDGIIYAVFVSLGFAFIENVLYVFSGGINVALARAVLAVPGHGFFAVLMGYHLSLAKLGPASEKQRHLQLSLLLPIIFHGLYDFALMYVSTLNEENPWLILGLLVLFTGVVIVLWITGIRRISKHLKLDQSASTINQNQVQL